MDRLCRKVCNRKTHAIFIAVEGNLAVGKSTMLTRLAEDVNSLMIDLESERLSVKAIVESVTDWTNHEGKNILHAFYANPKDNAYNFQHLIQASYIKQMITLGTEQAIAQRKYDNKLQIIVMERSLFSNRHVFTELAYKKGFITEAQRDTLVAQFESAVADHQFFPCLHGLIYLQSNPNKVIKVALTIVSTFYFYFFCFSVTNVLFNGDVKQK